MEAKHGNKRKARDKQLVIGIDPGTTFSGVAWCLHDRHYQGKSEDRTCIRIVQRWPVPFGSQRYEHKVPSTLRYNEGDATKWGYEVVDCDGNTLEWFKLALVPDKDLPPRLRESPKLKETKKKMRDLGLNATQVMAHYMEKIWTHALAEIKKYIKGEEFESIPIHIVITIPAIWCNQAIEVMKSAVGLSILKSRPVGLITSEFLSEPEAAVQAYAEELQLKLNLDDIVMVVDLGGGTGDIISYQMGGEGDEDHLELKEAAPGDGDLCGAIFTDEAFEKLLLRNLPMKYKTLKTKRPDLWRKLLFEQWQRYIKREFQWKGTGRIWSVTLSIVDNTLDVQLHEDEIREAFEISVMPKLLSLIERQVEAVKKAHDGKVPRIVLPVGGFGQCPYVLQRLGEQVERINGDFKGKNTMIEMLSDIGETPWSAVCKGACQHGLRAQRKNRLVKSRRSRISLGFIENEPSSKEEGGIWIPDLGEYMIEDALRLVIRKGDLIDDDKTWTMPMFLACDLYGKGIHTERSTIYAYHGDSIPKRYNKDDPNFQEYGVMAITTTKPIEKLPVEEIDGWERRVFYYNVEVKIVGGSVQLTATDDSGKEVGKFFLPELDTM